MKVKLLLVAMAAISANVSAAVNGVPVANSKTWTWAPTEINGGAVWGNGGYMTGEQINASSIEGAWWGCGPVDGECSSTFEEQISNYGLTSVPLDAYEGAYMVTANDGTISKYDKDGNLISTGNYGFEEWEDGIIVENPSVRGYLNTTTGAILWPYMINGAGYEPSRFEITYLTDDSMILVYAPEGTGSWGESTWWSFKSTDGVELVISSSNQKVDDISYAYDEDLDAAVVKKGSPDLEVANIKSEVEIDGTVYPVVFIANMAFSDSPSLKEVNIPESVKAIGEYAFSGCHQLETVKLPSALEEIGNGAFSWCEVLSNMDLPASLVTIADGGLCGCQKLEITALPESLRVLGIYALESCRITKLQIPDNLIIEPRAFLFSPITEFVINDSNPNYTAIDGNIYTKAGDTLVRLTIVQPESSSFTLPATCTALGDYSLLGCGFSGKTIQIPDQITHIGDGVFSRLFAEEVIFNDNVKSLGSNMFQYSSVLNVTLPANMPESIGNSFFTSSEIRDVKVPDSWTQIPANFCNDNYYLESFTYGDNVNTIGLGALAGTPSLKEFTLKPSVRDAGCYFLSYSAVEGAFNVPEGVEYFGKDDEVSFAFGMSPYITEITMPSTLKKPVSILTNMGGWFYGWEAVYGFPFEDGIYERPHAIEKVVNLSTVPLGIDYSIHLSTDIPADKEGWNTSINYFCLPGVGRYTEVWSESGPETSVDMEGCCWILSFSDVSVSNDVCTFTVETGSEEFEIAKVTYEGNVIEPVSQSRAGSSMTYSIEGIGASDLYKVSVEFKYAEYEVDAPFLISADGSVDIDSNCDAIFDSSKPVKISAENGSLYAHGAISGLTVSIYDNMGRQVALGRTSGAARQMIASGLAQGVYLVKVGATTSKVLVR